MTGQIPPTVTPGPPHQVPQGPPPWWPYPRRRRSWLRRLLVGFFVLAFVMSVLLNFYLTMALAIQFEQELETTTIRPGRDDQTIAVYKLQGVIGPKAVSEFAKFYEAVVDDDNVKAVVLRVNSPGGGVSTSDQIYRLVTQLMAEGRKTLVISMGGVAASGGYYVSAPADEIVAEPTTVTGSIGVIGGWWVLKGTLDKVGAEVVVLKPTHARRWKDEGMPFEKPAKHHLEHLQKVLNKIQDRFEQVVRKGRNKKGKEEKLKTREVKYTMQEADGDKARDVEHTETEPFNGKIYLADEALALGLVDQIGYLGKAIDRAGKLAGLTDPKVVRYKPKKGLLAELLTSRSSAALKLDVETLDKLRTPRLLLLWQAE